MLDAPNTLKCKVGWWSTWMNYMNEVDEWSTWMKYMNEVHEAHDWSTWIKFMNEVREVHERSTWMKYMNEVMQDASSHWQATGRVQESLMLTRSDALRRGKGSLLVANLDIMQPSVHPVHKVLHTRHVQHKVRQVPPNPKVSNPAVCSGPSLFHTMLCYCWQHAVQWHWQHRHLHRPE